MCLFAKGIASMSAMRRIGKVTRLLPSQRAASRTAPYATSFNSGTKTLILRWTALQKNTERSKPMCHARLI
jgi:hypothetical protein